MTTRAEGELLTRVGPGTPMGKMLREYWIPAALSSEVTANGPPTRLMLLGEQLIAFRDGKGRVFYEVLGHSEHVMAIPAILRQITAGIQYAAGDLAVDDSPSRK